MKASGPNLMLPFSPHRSHALLAHLDFLQPSPFWHCTLLQDHASSAQLLFIFTVSPTSPFPIFQCPLLWKLDLVSKIIHASCHFLPDLWKQTRLSPPLLFLVFELLLQQLPLLPHSKVICIPVFHPSLSLQAP